jgi:hypothetical protein
MGNDTLKGAAYVKGRGTLNNSDSKSEPRQINDPEEKLLVD